MQEETKTLTIGLQKQITYIGMQLKSMAKVILKLFLYQSMLMHTVIHQLVDTKYLYTNMVGGRLIN